jgi:hypothetical protein
MVNPAFRALLNGSRCPIRRVEKAEFVPVGPGVGW